MSSEIARLKHKFEHKHTVVLGQPSKSAPPPRATPAYHEMRLREQKRTQAEAAKVARQSAARYNLTLRAVALSSVKKATDERQRQLDEAQKARQLASHYNATVRALRVSMMGVNKAKQNQLPCQKISESDESSLPASPTIVPNAPAAVESKIALDTAINGKEEDIESKVEETVEETVPAQSTEVPSSAVASAKTEPEAVTEQIEVIEAPKPASRESSTQEGLNLSDVESAIQTGDEAVINEVVIRKFFEAVDPARAKDVPKLLEEFKGKEDELMNSILQDNSTPELDALDRSADSVVVSGEVPPDLGGFITGVQHNGAGRELSVSTVRDPQIDAFRTKLLARGMSENQIEKLIDDTSEML